MVFASVYSYGIQQLGKNSNYRPDIIWADRATVCNNTIQNMLDGAAHKHPFLSYKHLHGVHRVFLAQLHSCSSWSNMEGYYDAKIRKRNDASLPGFLGVRAG